MFLIGKIQQLPVSGTIPVCNPDIGIIVRIQPLYPLHLLHAIAVAGQEFSRQVSRGADCHLRPDNRIHSQCFSERKHPVTDACADNYHRIPLRQMFPDSGAGISPQQLFPFVFIKSFTQGIELHNGHSPEKIGEYPFLHLPVGVKTHLVSYQ